MNTTDSYEELLKLFLHEVPPWRLTFLAEESRDLHFLLTLARHDSAVVREGAAYGLSAVVEGIGTGSFPRYEDKLKALTELERLAADPSPSVQKAAKGALRALEE